VLGDLKEIEGLWQLSFTRRLGHPPEKVWRAITEPEHLKAWFPAAVEGERAQGATLRFVFPFEEAPVEEGEMLTYDPPSVLEFSWGADETLRFELQPEDGGTVLTLLNTFKELGKAARDAAGWHVCLEVLELHMDGKEPPPGKPWEELKPMYEERFGPEAATVGIPEWHPDAE
jgi:uncharacterized protein YndB with AHSA1/START domain